MEDRVNWWKNPSYWPIDRAEEYVSLFVATLSLGKAIFPQEWTGEEPYTQPLEARKAPERTGLEMLRASVSNSPKQIREHYELLQMHRPDIELAEPRAAHPSIPPYKLTHEQKLIAARLELELEDKAYAEELERVKNDNILSAPAKERMDKVIDAIAGAVCREELAWAYSVNGQFYPTDSIKEWRGNPLRQRFVCGMINVSDPYSSYIGPDGCAFIFFSKRDIDRLISAYSGVTVEPERAGKVDRTVKANVPAKRLREWADDYFSQFQGKKAPTHATAETAYREAFPEAGTTQFRKEVWPNRPVWMHKPRAPKGA